MEAGSGRRALDLISRQRFDTVMLDVMMPKIDGLEVLRRIRATHSASALPVIMVTARVQSEDIVAALGIGANDCVTKPVDFAVAQARVNAQIERKRAEAEAERSNERLRLANELLESRVSERTAKLAAANLALETEIAQRQQTEARNHYLAHHDALTGLGSSFGIVTTAEGVETQEQFDCLLTKGCGEVQGKLFSMPIPTEQIADMLRRLGQA